MGLEPTTARLRAARSTDWARKATDDTSLTTLFYQYYDYHKDIWYDIHTYIRETLHWHTVICRLLPTVPSLSFIFCMTVFLIYLPSHFRYLRAFAYSLSIVLSLLLCLRAIPFSIRLVRKLPWLSRQSDRLLTDRSLVRSQAEAPFLLFYSSRKNLKYKDTLYLYTFKKVRLPWVSNPRPRG